MLWPGFASDSGPAEKRQESANSLVGSFRHLGAGSRRVEIYTPEVRGGRQEFHSNADPLRATLSGEHDPAFLFFLSLRIHQYQHLVGIHFMAQNQQAAMSIHHQRFTDLAKLLPGMAAAQRLQLHAVEHALAAAIGGKGGFLHNVPMMSLARTGVNCPFGQVFRIATPTTLANL